MKLNNPTIFFYLILPFLFLNCETVPSEKVAQPWVRSLKSNELIKLGGKIKVEVSGVTTPLLGKEDLTSGTIRETLSYLLRRRGFAIDDAMPDYVVHLSYKSDRSDKLMMSSSITSTNVNRFAFATNSGVGATSGQG